MAKDDKNLKEDIRQRIIADKSKSKLDIILKDINKSTLSENAKHRIKYDLALKIIKDTKLSLS